MVMRMILICGLGKSKEKDGRKMAAGIEKTFKAMVRCAVGKDHTFVNMGTLANRTNVCHRTIERHIKILKDVGLINAVREEIKGWKQTVYYFLAHPVIAKFRAGKTKFQQKRIKHPSWIIRQLQNLNLKLS